VKVRNFSRSFYENFLKIFSPNHGQLFNAFVSSFGSIEEYLLNLSFKKNENNYIIV